MHPRILPLLSCLIALAAPRLAAGLPDHVVRGGLPRFFAACGKPGGEVRVAYFGGSITAAPGWRVKTREGFQQRWPGVTFTEIHAAIGGTGSDLGAFRCDRDVASRKPDLVFVEFAVNDAGAEPDRILRGMEGLVRQIWAANPNADICFVYTLAHNLLPDYQAGRLPRAAATMERLADHYGIPSILFGPEVARQVDAGTLIFKADQNPKDGKPVFAIDGVHPLVETGHVIYAEQVRKAFDAWAAAGGATTPRTLPAPLMPDAWQEARTHDVRDTWIRGEGWQRLDPAKDDLAKRFRDRLPVLWQAQQPGASLEFSFEGTMVGLFDLLGPDGGQVRVWVDGQDKGLRARFDSYCTYHRLAPLWLAENLAPGKHTVKVELTAEPLDKAAILAKRGEKIDKPERFAPLRWQVGAVMVVGRPD